MEEHRKAAGQRAAKIRDAKGWNQEDLAHATGLAVKTISRFENGKHDGRRTTIKRIADALEVDQSDIVGPPPEPLGLGENQLDRLERMLAENNAMLGRVLELIDPQDPAGDTAEVLTEATLADDADAAAELAPRNGDASDATPASPRPRAPRRRKAS